MNLLFNKILKNKNLRWSVESLVREGGVARLAFLAEGEVFVEAGRALGRGLVRKMRIGSSISESALACAIIASSDSAAYSSYSDLSICTRDNSQLIKWWISSTNLLQFL